MPRGRGTILKVKQLRVITKVLLFCFKMFIIF